MKVFLVILFLLMAVVVGIWAYFSFLAPKTPPGAQTQTQQKQPVVTMQGSLQKASDPNGEYSYLLTTRTTSVGVNSYSIHLDTYIGKNVEISGEYSGTILYADTVKILP